MTTFEQFAEIAKELVMECGGVEVQITKDLPYKDSGLLDSVGTLTLMARCEDELGLVIPPKAFSEALTFGDLFDSAE